MGPGVFFVSANSDLADILGDTDFDFEICFARIQKFQISRFPDFQKSGLGRAGPGLGRASALGRGGPRVGSHGFPRVSTGFHGFPTGFPWVSHGPGPRVGRALGS